MRRAVKLVGLFWSTGLATEMEYRLNFVLATVSSLGNLAGSAFGIFLVFNAGGDMGGWSWHEALVVMGMFTILEGVSNTWLRPNLREIVRHVRQGTMDFVLLRPVDSQLWLSTRHISLWGFPDIVFGIAIIGYAGANLGLGPLDYAQGIVPLAVGTTILYSLWFILSSSSIWFVRVHNLTSVLRGVLEAGRFPVAAFPATYRVVFTFVIPIAFLTTVPAAAIVGRSRDYGLPLAVLLAAGLFALSRFFWKYALRFYTSASS